MVKNQINSVMFIIKSNAFLPYFKTKSGAKFDKKLL